MESIDALAKAIQEFDGGLVLVSHDMRLIGQVAKEIWICDNKTITKYNGDILNFKMDMRAQMGIEGDQPKSQQGLRGDASVQQKPSDKKPAAPPPKPKPQPKLEVVVPPKPAPAPAPVAVPAPVSDPAPPQVNAAAAATTTTTTTTTPTKTGASSSTSANSGGRYIPPHLRRKASS
jgi:hypothetical protein